MEDTRHCALIILMDHFPQGGQCNHPPPHRFADKTKPSGSTIPGMPDLCCLSWYGWNVNTPGFAWFQTCRSHVHRSFQEQPTSHFSSAALQHFECKRPSRGSTGILGGLFTVGRHNANWRHWLRCRLAKVKNINKLRDCVNLTMRRWRRGEWDERACVFNCMYVRMCVNVCTCVCVCERVYAHMCMCVCACVCMHVYVWPVCLSACVCVKFKWSRGWETRAQRDKQIKLFIALCTT